MLNFRPIALLTPFSKLYEKCIYERFNNFFNKYKIINDNQFGFKKNCSIENAILKTVNEISKNLEENKSTVSLFLDLKKAFETVNHSLLLNKLAKYGIRGPALELAKSFLTNRRQYVLANNTKSSCREITCGIPQGSTLGPLFFVIFINDIFLCSNFRINLFADDAYLSLSDVTNANLEVKANKELEKINAWIKYNKLALNMKKSTFIVFSKRKEEYKIKLKVGNEFLDESEEVKYLGVILDKNLHWTPQINKIEKKVANSCWAMSKLRKFSNDNTLKRIYHATIYPQLRYCISCWGGVPLSRRNHLIILQKRAIRIISKAHRLDHTTSLFKQQNLLKIPEIYTLSISIIMYKINNGSWIGNLNMQKLDSTHSYGTRLSHNQNFSLPTIRTNVGKNSFVYMGPKIWSQISLNIKNLPIAAFKKAISKFLLEAY